MTTTTTTAGPHPNFPEVDDANTYWSDAAAAAIRNLAATGTTFDAADVRALTPGEPTHQNVPGQVFAAMRRAGVIEIVNYGPSRRRSVRGAAVAQWRGTRRAREAGEVL